MATEVQTMPAQPQAPQLTVINRVASIPLVSDSLAALHATLVNNTYTKTPYFAAQAIGTKAYQFSEPIQVRLAPVLTRADGLANKAVDIVESRYPYPFKTPTGEIYGDLRQHTEHAYVVANKTIDDRVRTPAYGLAQGVDKRFTPVVDRFEEVVNKIHGKASDTNGTTPNGTDPSASKEQLQYQRAYRLSMDLKDQIFVITQDQYKQLQEHNVLIQRATATAHNVSNALSSQYGVASQRIQSLSDTMLSELHALQKSAAQLPSQAQAGLQGLSERVGSVAGEVNSILRSEGPIAEKLGKLKEAVEHQVQPLLASASSTVNSALKAVRGRVEDAKSKPATDAPTTANGSANGSANGHAVTENGTDY